MSVVELRITHFMQLEVAEYLACEDTTYTLRLGSPFPLYCYALLISLISSHFFAYV